MISNKLFLNLLLILLLFSEGCMGNSTATTSSVISAAPETIAFTTKNSPPTATETTIPSNQPVTPAITDSPLDFSQMSVDEWSSTSPDGKWIAAGLVAFPKANTTIQQAYVRLMIFITDGITHWTVIDEWQEIGLGFPIPVPLKWSQDGKYFYFTYRVTPDGCSAFPFLTDAQQVNLQNGTVKDLLPDTVLALALSPDDSQIAYFHGGPETGLVVKDLATGEERKVSIDLGKASNIGNIIWSPDAEALALTLAINPCAGEYSPSKAVWAESTTVLWVDAETLQQRILIDEDPRLFITMEWKGLEKIVIADEINSIWNLDVATKEITRP